MALVDSTHPEQINRWLALLPAKAAGEDGSISMLRLNLNQQIAFIEPYAEPVRAAGSLGSLPLAVLVQSPSRGQMFSTVKGINDALNAEWQVMQKELAMLSTNSVHKVSGFAGHMIPSEDPALVTDAILDLLKQVKGK